jgi:aspartate/methionine/tyrosine aminotransferase
MPRFHGGSTPFPARSPTVTTPPADLRFPYMAFARSAGGRARYSLVSSGMPPADARLFGAELPDLGFANAEALPRLQERLGAHLGVAPEQVIVTVGASAAMLVLALALFRGARVAVETPSYEPLRALPGALGGELRPFERRASERFAVDPERVRRALEGGRGPGHVLLSTPHNPSGALVARDALRAAADAAEEHGGYLISNEVYLEFAPPELRSPRGACASAVHAAPRSISIGSLTKAYGLGALRLGWIALGEEARDLRLRIEDAAFLDYVDPPTPILRLGLTALAELERLRAPYERFAAESKPVLARWLAETPGVEGAVGDHGLMAFPRLPGIDDTQAFQRHCVRAHDVDVVPGEYFGAPGHVRVGFGLEPSRLEEALARLSRALASA